MYFFCFHIVIIIILTLLMKSWKMTLSGVSFVRSEATIARLKYSPMSTIRFRALCVFLAWPDSSRIWIFSFRALFSVTIWTALPIAPHFLHELIFWQRPETLFSALRGWSVGFLLWNFFYKYYGVYVLIPDVLLWVNTISLTFKVYNYLIPLNLNQDTYTRLILHVFCRDRLSCLKYFFSL